MKCSKYIACRDPLKGPKHSCKSFVRLKEIGSFEDLYASISMLPQGVEDPDIALEKETSGIKIRDLVDATPGIAKTKRVLDGVKIATPEEVKGGVNDVEGDFIWQAMQSSYDPFTNSVRDIKIDDRALKLSTNYYHFCTKIAGSAIKAPFSRQLYVAMILLGEYCPRCTDEKWLDITNVPVDMESKDLVKKVVLLDNGVCPKCSATKSGLILGGEMKDYNELAIVQGQRCVVGATRLQTRIGFKTFTDLEEIHADSSGSTGFVEYKGPDLVDYDGSFVRPSYFYRSGKTKTLKLTTSIGQELTGTPEHPLWTKHGWKKLSELKVGDELELHIGQDAWSTDEFSLEGMADSIILSEHHTRHQQSASTLTPKIAGLIGFLVSEGSSYVVDDVLKSTRIHNNDINVINYCKEAILTIFPSATLQYRDNTLFIGEMHTRLFLNKLMDNRLIVDRKSAGRVVPSCIKVSPKPVVQEFLRCMFEGDGGLNGNSVEYTSISKTLVADLHAMLLNIGIPCRVRSKMAWASNGSSEQVSKPCYILEVSGSYAVYKFKEIIGFKSQRKNALLSKKASLYNNYVRETEPSWYGYLSSVDSSRVIAMYEEINSELRAGRVKYYNGGRSSQVSLRSAFQLRVRTTTGLVTKYNAALLCNSVLNASDIVVHLSDSVLKKLRYIKRLSEDRSTIHITVKSVSNEEKQETYDVHIPGTHRFMAEGLLNHNSGKSAFSSTLSAYLLHRYMKAPRMSDICRGIQEFTPLTATFVGLTAARAIKNLWNPFMSIVNGSTWFTEYFEMLRDYGRRYDKELYKRAGLYLRIFHRNLDLYPAPPLKRTLRGDTRFLGATDELSFFNFNPNKNADGDDDDEEKEHADGEEVQQSLSNSLTTVRTEVLHLYKKGINTIPTGYNLSMSSPFSENDTLCRLERDSHNEDSLTFGIRLPTWEVNPLYQRNHPIIVEAYRRNTVKAERDFGANPPQITSALYQPGTIEMLFTPGRPNSHRLLYLDHVKYTRGKSVHVTPKDAYQPAIMTLDAGLVNNAFAMVVAHRRDTTMEVDLVIELVPQPGKQVDFPFLYDNIILPIIKDMNVVLVSADRWNSINILQQIEKDVEGCKVSQKTLQYKDFTHFSASVYAGEVKLPALEMPMDRILVVRDFKKELLNAPISHLALQMTTVKDTGVAVVKGDGYTDDMFRALVLNHQQMFSTKHKTHMNRARIKSSSAKKTDKSRAFVISAPRSIYSRGGM
jgi:intein/homing endonuclease